MRTVDERAYLVEFGAAIRSQRTARGMTLEQLAELAGLSFRYLSDIERGERNPGILNVARIAAALDMDVITPLRELPPLRRR